MTLSFGVPDDEAGLTVRDPIERRQVALETPGPVAPTTTPTDRLAAPVDDAVRLETSDVSLGSVVAAYVRDADGEMVAVAEHFASHELSAGRYEVELCAPIKLYLRVASELTVEAGASSMRLEFGEETEVVVGARSHHERPAATVTVTPDPVDVMAGVSVLGSALKTTSPERSFPTLRGHPPTLELGEALDVPGDVERPQTGVRIELPPERRYAYVAAPLAYYLGAAVEPGGHPRLVTDEGLVHPLDGPGGFEKAVERTLKQVFLLDCVARTEGHYRVELHERREVDRRVDLDFAALYDSPLADRLAAYLSVPYDAIADHVPAWKLTTHVAPTPENVEVLPFLVDDLAVIRTPEQSATRVSVDEVEAVEEFVRDGALTRSTAGATGDGPALVEPERTDSLEQAWVGEDAPVGASKVTADAFRNRLDREPTDGDIEVAVVCNDARMLEEHDVVGEVYGSREELPFEVDLRREASVAELRSVLAADVEFLHYIGHIDAEGFECRDGTLDARELDAVGMDAFLLNACTSYEQGMTLIDAGAIGGVVTVADVVDSGALEVGSILARLLNQGFPLRAALEVAGSHSVVGGRYLVIGDGNLEIAQPETAAVKLDVKPTGGGYEVTHTSYPTTRAGMGSMISHSDAGGVQFLNSGEIDSYRVSRTGLVELLELLPGSPVEMRGEFVWSHELLEDLQRGTTDLA